jgi:hypothetical protein
MAQKKTEKNTEVVIMLDRPRFVRFGHRALKKLSALTNRKLNEAISTEDFNMEELEKIMYCGLLSDAKENNETLKLEDMEDLLDRASSFNEIVESMNQALDKAFQQTEHQKN